MSIKARLCGPFPGEDQVVTIAKLVPRIYVPVLPPIRVHMNPPGGYDLTAPRMGQDVYDYVRTNERGEAIYDKRS